MAKNLSYLYHDRFLTNATRVANRSALESLIEGVTSKRTTKEWIKVFDGAPVPHASIKYL